MSFVKQDKTCSMENKKKLLFPFIAPPNGGKGTQTHVLATQYGLPAFDMGATFRSILKDGSDVELKAELDSYMNKGRLVPIETVVKVFEKSFQKLVDANPGASGFILDGFPRNLEQAYALEAFCKRSGSQLSVAKAIYLNVGLDVVKRRAIGRRFCSDNPRHVYNIFIESLMPVSQSGNSKEPLSDSWLCPVDSAALVLREDDKVETVEKRLIEYQKETDPLIDYFRSNGMLLEVDGELSPEEITLKIMSCITPLLKVVTV